jgi:hypothetical protein
MKLRARQKYDYRDLERGEAQLMRVDMHFGEIVENWVTRCPKERALTQPSRAFGRPRENTEQNWPRKGLCGSRSFGRHFRSFAISPT